MGAYAAVPQSEENLFPLRHQYDSTEGNSGLVRIIKEIRTALGGNNINYVKFERSIIEGGEYVTEVTSSCGLLVCRAPVKRSRSANMVIDQKPKLM